MLSTIGDRRAKGGPHGVFRRGRQMPAVPAFTLVELLVVIGIIALLISILLPALNSARRSSADVYCRSNLKQVALALRMYANDHNDHYPDGYTLGGAPARVLPGMKAPGDPNAAPEVFGMPALLQERGYLKSLKVWTCPSATDEVQSWGNSYIALTIGGVTLASVTDVRPSNAAKWQQSDRGKEDNRNGFFVYDNFSTRPWSSGSRRTSGSLDVIPTTAQVYPHTYSSKRIVGARQGSINMLFIDGHVGVVAYRRKPGSTTPETVFIREP